ncbi:MAG: hypothetical protein LBJ67_02890 [Planctomycetaceae bacterium]|jgi:hypothetical protein|nr:hypothetical protein [Planctomycetaceae bacterium]
MASIASLALKIQADIGNVTENIRSVVNSIDAISVASQKTHPGLRGMQNALTGMNIMLDNVTVASQNAAESFSNSDFGQDQIDEAVETMEKMQDAAKAVFDANVQGAERSAAAIGKMPPTIKSVNTVLEEMKTLSDFNRLDFGNIGVTESDLQRVDDVMKSMTQSANELGIGVAKSISDLKPTMENIYAAQKKIDELKQTAAQIQETTGDETALADAIALAEENAGALASKAVEFQLSMESVKATLFSINNIPFAVLSNFLTEVLNNLKFFGQDLDNMFNGIPGKIIRVTVVIGSLVVAIGLAHARMTTLGVSTTYFTSLIKSSMIYQGLAGFAAMLDGTIIKTYAAAAGTAVWTAATYVLTAAQWALNIAMAANPIGAVFAIALAIIAAIAAVIYGIWSWFSRSAKEAENLKNQISNMEASTAAFRDRLAETADRYRELNNLAKNFADANMSGADKYQKKLEEINEVLRRPQIADEMIAAYNLKEIELVRALENAQSNGQQDLIDSIQKQLNDLRNDRENVAKDVQNSPVFTEQDAASARERARMEYLRGQYGDMLNVSVSAQDKYNDTVQNLNDDLNAGRINAAEYATVLENARIAFEQNDPATKEMAELKKKFQEMTEKTPVRTFDQLTTELERVRNSLSPEELTAASRNLIGQLKTDLGIGEYLIPDVAGGELETKQAELSAAYEKLIQYANRAGMSDEELADAKSRAARAILGQTEASRAIFDAMDALRPAAEKITQAQNEIVETAAALRENGQNITEEAINEALRKVEEKYAAPEAKEQGQEKQQNATNAALERGSMAYFETLQKQNDPLLKESQKQTKALTMIAENTGKTEKAKELNDFALIG